MIISIASVTATIVGRPSGTAATINTILSINALENCSNICPPVIFSKSSAGSEPVKPITQISITWTTKMRAAAIAPSVVISLPSLASFSCRGVLDLS